MIDEKRLREVCRKNSIPDGNIFIEALEDWIEELPKIGEWIPVSEKLPEKDGKYLVTQESYIGEPPKHIDIARYGTMMFAERRGRIWYRSDSEWGDVELDDVLAWMPLPEPWEGEK